MPSRRTRDPEEVSIAWQIDAYRFELPLMVLPDGQRGLAGHRDRRSAGSAGWPCSTWKGCGPGTRTRSRCWPRSPSCDEQAATRRLQEIYAEPIKEDLIGRRIEEIRAAGVTTAARLSPQRTVALLQGGHRRGRGHLRHPRHHGVGRARLRPGRAAQPQAVHLRARRPGDRRRLRHLHRRAAPDAHRRRRGAGRLRRRVRRTPPRRCSAWRCRWPPRSPTWPRPGATTWTSPAAATCT